MIRDYYLVSEYCVVIIQDCDSPEGALERLRNIVINPNDFRCDNLEDDDQLEECQS